MIFIGFIKLGIIMKSNELNEENELKAQLEYWELFQRSGYKAKRVLDVNTGRYREIVYKDIEVVDYFLSGGDYEKFKRTGVGLITFVNEDECRKVLMTLEGQVLTWHSHVSVLVIPPGYDIPEGFIDMNEKAKGFVGLKDEFPSDYIYAILKTTDIKDFTVPDELKGVAVKIKGKEEAFRFHYGSASLWIPCREGEHTINPVRPIPDEHNQVKFAREYVFKIGDIVHLPTNTFHLIVGGTGGAVYTEASTKSRDELDLYLHPGIKRLV